jgi:predicted peptidase
MKQSLSFRRRTGMRAFAVIALWAGANLAALAWIEHIEVKALERKYGVSDEVIRRFEERRLSVSIGHETEAIELPYRLLEPKSDHVPPPYPVVVFLHGSGERGSDNIRQLRSLPTVLAKPEMRERFPCFLIAPQCPPHLFWGGGGLTNADPLNAVVKVLDEVLTRPDTDRNRVYLTGFSMGGFGCWELAARHPERFAAAVPVAGGGDPAWGERLKNLPLLAVHGDADNVVPTSSTREMIAAVRNAGGSPRYLELPGVGHAAWKPAFRDSEEGLEWLFQQS